MERMEEREKERERNGKTNSVNCDSDRNEAPEVIFHLISFQQDRKEKNTKGQNVRECACNVLTGRELSRRDRVAGRGSMDKTQK